MIIGEDEPVWPGFAACGLSVGRACANDLDAIAELEESVFPPTQRWHRDSWESELCGESMRTLVVRSSDRLNASAGTIGVLALRLLGEQADLDRVMVAPSARRRGIGRRLVIAGMGEASGSAATEMILEVAQQNLAAIKLYESLGFAALADRPGYYGPGQDATIMKRTLP